MPFLKATKKRKTRFAKPKGQSFFKKINLRFFSKKTHINPKPPVNKSLFRFLRSRFKLIIAVIILVLALNYVWNLFITKQIICYVGKNSCDPQLLHQFDYLNGKFIYLNDNKDIDLQKNNADYSWIDKIHLKADFPSKVIVKIYTLEPLAIVKDRFDKEYYLADNGKIFLTDKKVAGLTEVKTQKAIILGENENITDFKFIAQVLRYLKINHLQIERALEISDLYWEFDLKMGKKVYFTQEKTAQSQVDALQFILINSKMKDIDQYREIDLRYLDPVLR